MLENKKKNDKGKAISDGKRGKHKGEIKEKKTEEARELNYLESKQTGNVMCSHRK